ncbi:hypothetical protein BCU49_006530 [Vibrio breoganii]
MHIVEILLVEAPHKPGYMAKVLGVIGAFGATVEGLNAVSRLDKETVWEVTLEYDDSLNIQQLFDQINQLPDTSITGKSDRVFNRHKQGKIKTVSAISIDSLEILRDLYTPGVARSVRQFSNLRIRLRSTPISKIPLQL